MRRLRMALAVLLAVEALNSVLWAARILSAAPAYDAVVLFMVLLRVAVSTLQGVGAWMLTADALPAFTFARLAFALAAVLLVFEIGFRLSPSSIQPGLRLPVVVAYILYASSCVRVLALVERAERSR
jgi:hypothetical protein